MELNFWEFNGYKANLHEGINILFSKNGYQFDLLGMFLSYTAKLISPQTENITYTDAFYLDFINSNTFEVLDNDNIFRFTLQCNNGNIDWHSMKKCSYNEYAKKMPTYLFSYFKKGSRINLCSLQKLEDYKEYLFRKDYFYIDNFGRQNFYKDQLFWMNMFVKNELEPTKYTKFHCDAIKTIIDEMIAINGYYDFSFSHYSNTFVVYKNGIPENIGIRDYDVGSQIGMIMHLYKMFLQNHTNDFLQLPTEEKGIVVSDIEFGERPSYSDKKWKYYDILYKYFKGIQFIMI